MNEFTPIDRIKIDEKNFRLTGNYLHDQKIVVHLNTEEEKEQLEKLANAIDDVIYDYDFYDYMDNLTGTRAEYVEEIKNNLIFLDVKEYLEGLNNIIDAYAEMISDIDSDEKLQEEYTKEFSKAVEVKIDLEAYINYHQGWNDKAREKYPNLSFLLSGFEFEIFNSISNDDYIKGSVYDVSEKVLKALRENIKAVNKLNSSERGIYEELTKAKNTIYLSSDKTVGYEMEYESGYSFLNNYFYDRKDHLSVVVDMHTKEIYAEMLNWLSEAEFINKYPLTAKQMNFDIAHKKLPKPALEEIESTINKFDNNGNTLECDKNIVDWLSGFINTDALIKAMKDKYEIRLSDDLSNALKSNAEIYYLTKVSDIAQKTINWAKGDYGYEEDIYFDETLNNSKFLKDINEIIDKAHIEIKDKDMGTIKKESKKGVVLNER